jgi:hypothetical protein
MHSTFPIQGMYFMEKIMKVFDSEFETQDGKINHSVHVDWDDKGNLHFMEHDLGEGVKGFWGEDEYEYFFMVHQKDVARFILYAFWKGFTFKDRLNVGELRDMCDEFKIEYSTDNWF